VSRAPSSSTSRSPTTRRSPSSTVSKARPCSRSPSASGPPASSTTSRSADGVDGPLACVPFTADHVPAAAAAAAAAAGRLRTRVPAIPARWLEPGPHAAVLERLAAEGSGCAAILGTAYAGHLVAWTWGDGPAARTFAPEAGLAVAPGLGQRVARRVVEELVTMAGRRWTAEGARTHLVAVPVDEAAVRDALVWLGYGMVVVDAVRELDGSGLAALPSAPPPGTRIRTAGPDDLDAILALDRGLRRHLVDAPTFLVLRAAQDPARIAARLADPATATFLAEVDDAPAAYLRAGPPGDDIALLVRDPGTTSIDAAYTVPSCRGDGVAAALLDAAARWARDRGAVRLGVDFESANVLGARFWTRWFTPVVASYIRRLDPAAGSAAASPDAEDLPGTVAR
jgi:GNAT superfamily N-acetyltransferase